MSAAPNETGNRYGKLQVLHRGQNGDNSGGIAMWWCSCDCGRVKLIRGASLRNGNTTACGDCRERHGYARRGQMHPMYRAWSAMHQRCENPNSDEYVRYGARGIVVCERWSGLLGFIHYLEDMGERPSGKTVDRIDNDGAYCPENCRWATALEQAQNRRPMTRRPKRAKELSR